MGWGTGITKIGITAFKGKETQFGIKDNDRLLHLSLIGKTGSGRAGFLTAMMLQDIERGMGAVLLDGTGNVAELLLERLSVDARSRLIYIDPSDAEYPFSWNPLDDIRALPPERSEDFLKSLLISMYRLRPNALSDYVAKKLLSLKDGTILSLYDAVTDIGYRDSIFPPDSPERAEFESAFDASPEAVETIQRNGRYLAKDTLMRNLLGQRTSKFTLQALAHGAVVVVDLSRVKMFPTRFTPLVRVFAHGARLASVVSSLPPSLYAHDVIRLLSDRDLEWFFNERSIAGVISDAVHVEEDKDFREKTLARSGSVAAFAPATYDAPIIERVFFPYIGPEDFHKLDVGELAVTLTIDGVRTRPFFAHALPVPPRENVSRHDIQVSSRERYATPRHVVDQLFVRRKTEKPKEADPAAFSSAFRSIFAKGAQDGASPAAPKIPPKITGAQPAASAPKEQAKPAEKADVNTEPQEVSEEELRKMLHVNPIRH
jgi:hypothetical protein